MSAEILMFLPAAITIEDIAGRLGGQVHEDPDGSKMIGMKREGSIYVYPYSDEERQREHPETSWTWVNHYVDPWRAWVLRYSGAPDAKWSIGAIGEKFGGAVDNGAGWLGRTSDFLELVDSHDKDWDWRLEFLDLEATRST